MHFVRLLDDQTFEFISTYPLDAYEYGCSIISCSYSDDNNAYYCVGTAYVLPEENEPSKVSLSYMNCIISALDIPKLLIWLYMQNLRLILYEGLSAISWSNLAVHFLVQAFLHKYLPCI